MASPSASVKDMEALLEKTSPTDAARTIEKANVTSEELDKIQSSMKDPEFKRMLTEYMTEIQSPETRKEYEDMLQNADGIPGMTKPEGKRLLKPEPLCTLEVNHQGDGRKVYATRTLRSGARMASPACQLALPVLPHGAPQLRARRGGPGPCQGGPGLGLPLLRVRPSGAHM